MNKFILSNSSKICCMAERAETFTTKDSHFVRPHENFSSCNLLITEDVQSMDRKEWLCFIVWNANSPSSGAICLHSSVTVSFVKKDVNILLQLLVSAAFACVLFLICCSI
jgi:hypothetical protein